MILRPNAVPACSLAGFALALGMVALVPAAQAVAPVDSIATLRTRYAGTLPCADCAGIRMDLTLIDEAETGKPREFRLKETYLGARDGERSFTSHGSYSIVREAQRTTLWLTPQVRDLSQARESRRGFVFDGIGGNGGNGGKASLTLLDRAGKRIVSSLNYRLDRLPPRSVVLPRHGEIPLPVRFDGDDADGTGGNDLALDLREDGTFVFRVATGGGTPAYTDFGTFRFNAAGTRLVLTGGAEAPHRFGVVDSRTLLRLDNRGRVERPTRDLRTVDYAEVEDALHLVGQFTSLADAPRFSECASGRSWPVAMSGDYPALEKAYTARRAQLKLKPGTALQATVLARLVSRPGMEDGQPDQATLVVEKFERLDGLHPCPVKGRHRH
ncbi:hypothetical protein OTERR_16030 [Oryzomicrobium terrae]|uniref:NlpE C-terminal OB domain-containing protein n=1 Tax=Oryzomicrobium terrae TaxID=1735038 RepID=A0A5C1E8Y4_9RHOO|nr:copper resistance protein NlpE N-terminal domain-containing protein [Oryzomicrobium terrae]QEL65079.1 hypothetical protein OTERR_16030 [Oryzomicrobium terrae]